jgi:hypothetical protein
LPEDVRVLVWWCTVPHIAIVVRNGIEVAVVVTMEGETVEVFECVVAVVNCRILVS